MNFLKRTNQFSGWKPDNSQLLKKRLRTQTVHFWGNATSVVDTDLTFEDPKIYEIVPHKINNIHRNYQVIHRK